MSEAALNTLSSKPTESNRRWKRLYDGFFSLSLLLEGDFSADLDEDLDEGLEEDLVDLVEDLLAGFDGFSFSDDDEFATLGVIDRWE